MGWFGSWSVLSRDSYVSFGIGAGGGSTTMEDRLLAQGWHPAWASTSSYVGDMGVWCLPENLLALLRRWEKKLSLCAPLGGDASPELPFKARSACCLWISA